MIWGYPYFRKHPYIQSQHKACSNLSGYDISIWSNTWQNKWWDPPRSPLERQWMLGCVLSLMSNSHLETYQDTLKIWRVPSQGPSWKPLNLYIQYVWKIEDVQLQLLQTCDLKSPRVFFGIQAAELHFFRLFRHNFGGGRNHRHSGSNHRRSRGHSSYLAVEMIGLSGLWKIWNCNSSSASFIFLRLLVLYTYFILLLFLVLLRKNSTLDIVALDVFHVHSTVVKPQTAWGTFSASAEPAKRSQISLSGSPPNKQDV